MSRSVRSSVVFLLVVLFFTPFLGSSKPLKRSGLSLKAENRLKDLKSVLPGWEHLGKIGFDSLTLLTEKKLIQIYFSAPLSYIPIREIDVRNLEKTVSKSLGRRFRKYKLALYSDHHLVNELVPNKMRIDFPVDKNRLSDSHSDRIPVVTRVGKDKPVSGLFNNNIAIWDSHGWYYELKQDRWKWQRARLFGTVEDMSPMSFILPYLTPMLENSGATVFIPRERDWQNEEVIVDNDRSTAGSELHIPSELVSARSQPGYLLKDTLFSGENPFLLGSSLKFNDYTKHQDIQYIPSFNVAGQYSVSISYQSDSASLSNVIYSVYHTGGKAQFLVNQKIGGGTWIYLGTFDFAKGKNSQAGMVTVSYEGTQKGAISVDAVKFGGGKGNVARRPANDASLQTTFNYKLSGKPRYLEGSRYYLQSAGFPDTLTYNLNNNKNDYNDDYQSRGEWVNYLMGSPNGPERERKNRGLKIPVDLALAFHTDAGITPNDSIIGTLGIYSTYNTKPDKGLFPDGKSRLGSRDLSDIIQTQVVDDIRYLFNPQWTRRGLWDKAYSEAWRPNVPAMLLELLSHQNLADMRFGLDPRFRFAASRAIYKGILKFQSYQENRPFIVQPLPVDHFSIAKTDSNSVRLSWHAVTDPTEVTAKADKFKVYKRINDEGFDNGVLVEDTVLVLKLDQFDTIYSYKVTAINSGGESFPGETLSVGFKSKSKGNILVVNGFNRICAPSIFDNAGMSGVAWWKDRGVADHQDISFVGDQYDFDRNSKWLDDDSPGWGASYGNMEGKVIPGNSFDFPYIHGKAIMAAGYSFVSASDEVFCKAGFDSSPFFATDIIFGEERSTPAISDHKSTDFKIYTPQLMAKVTEITKKGGNLFLSGAYIGSDFGENKDSLVAEFVRNTLHFTWRTGHASKGGDFYATDYARKWLTGKWNFNVTYNPAIYAVEAPDGIEPAGQSALCAFRYSENNVSAGILFKGKYRVVAMGLPFETISDSLQQVTLMQQIINFFESK